MSDLDEVSDLPSSEPEIAAADITPKAEALRGLPPEWRERLIERAAAMGVRADGDVAWLLVGAFINAWAGAAAAGEAADRIEGATKNVGDMIYRQAQAAGKDLAAAAGQVIEQKTVEAGQGMVAVIQHAANAGAGALRAAAQSLPAAAQAQKAAIIQDWKTSLLSLATQEAVQRARRSEWIWGGAVVAIVAFAALVSGWAGYSLAPVSWPAASPPAVIAQFQDETEYQWVNTNAGIEPQCPPNRICLVLKK